MLLYKQYYTLCNCSAGSAIMASESCTSIIDWLSDVEVEASAHWEQYSLQDPSFPCATSSPPIHFSPSPSSPCFVGLQNSRKRKHHGEWLDSCPKDPYFPREPLKEIMSSPNKRARTNSGPIEEERADHDEVRSIDQGTAPSSFLTIINSNHLLKHLERRLQQAHNLSYKHLLPLSRTRPQAVKGRKISQACLRMPTR